MTKLLEKALKDAIKDDKVTIGTKQVLNSIKNSKLIVFSKSVGDELEKEIDETTKKEKVPLVNFEGTSVALGKLCGLQFRISSIAFNSLSESNIKSILKESNQEQK